MGIHLLTELGVQNKKKPGLYGDGGGLYLQVTKGKDDEPCRSWIFRYAVHTPVGPDEPAGGSPDKRKKSKERKMGLGPLDTVGLAEAREKALECRKLRDKGLDPIEEKARKNREAALQVVKNITFEEAVKAYIAAHKGEWRNAKHLQQWGTSLKTHCYPLLGNLMVRDIDSGLVVRVVEPMWRTIPTTASRVRGRIESVLDWGKANGYRTGENPAKWDDNLKHTLMDHKKADRKKLRKKKHHAALPHAQMPEFVVALRTRQTTAAQCLEFVILTAARSGEAIKAKWDEFSIDEKVWIVPAERMKGEREHRVPLSPAAIAVIERMQKVRCNDYVFAGPSRR